MSAQGSISDYMVRSRREIYTHLVKYVMPMHRIGSNRITKTVDQGVGFHQPRALGFTLAMTYTHPVLLGALPMHQIESNNQPSAQVLGSVGPGLLSLAASQLARHPASHPTVVPGVRGCRPRPIGLTLAMKCTTHLVKYVMPMN